MLARSGEITDPCPVPLSLTVTTPSSRTPALSHFWIRRMMRRSPTRCSTNLMSHSWLTVEERADVSVQYPVHLCAGDPDHERIHRIVRAASGSEPIREPEEIFLVDRAQHRSRGPLDDLVLKGGDRDRALPTIRLGYVAPP